MKVATEPSQAVCFRSHAPEFAAVLGDAPRLVRLLETDAHEGPVYVHAEDALYFTALPRRDHDPDARHDGAGAGLPRVAIKRLALDGDLARLGPDRITMVRDAANAANGMCLDRDGRRLIVCEQGTLSSDARIATFDPVSKTVATVVDDWGGLRLNSPNDVVVHSDGSIWFTDPSYGHLQGFRPEPQVGDHVYRYDPRSGRAEVVADSFDKPNGLAFSPDQRILYVTDSGANQTVGSYHLDRPHHVMAFDVLEGGRLGGPRLFAVISPGFPDGIEVDSDGRVYVSSFSGVQVFDPAGDLIGEIALPGAVNFAFGGRGRNVLFITTDDAVWAAFLRATGPPPTSPSSKGA